MSETPKITYRGGEAPKPHECRMPKDAKTWCHWCETPCLCWRCGSPLTYEECMDGYDRVLDPEDRNCKFCPERKYRFTDAPGIQVEKEQP